MTETAVPLPRWNGKTEDWLAWGRTLDPELADDTTREDIRSRFAEQWQAQYDAEHGDTAPVTLVPADPFARSVEFAHDGDAYVVTSDGLTVDADTGAALLEAAPAAGVLLKVKE